MSIQAINPRSQRANKKASQIASVLQATRHVDKVWATLSEGTVNGLIDRWADLIIRHPGAAPDKIFCDLMKFPDLKSAWESLSHDEQESRKKVFKAILQGNGY